MGVLRGGGGAGFPDPLFLADIRVAPVIADKIPCSGGGFVRNAQAVGTHIGDQTNLTVARHFHAFVQALCGPHGAGSREAERAAGILLKRGGDERRLGLAAALALIHLGHDIAAALECGENGIRLLLVFDGQLFAVRSGGEMSGKARAAVLGLECGIKVPVFFRLEVFHLNLAVADDADRHALHPSGGQALADLVPQKRAEFIAHQAVQLTPGLLGVKEVHVDGAGMRHALLNAFFGNLIKGDAVRLGRVKAQNVCKVPADGFALTVRVGRKVDFVGVFRLGLQFLDERAFALDGDIFRLIVIFHVNAQRAGGQIADMAHTGHDGITLAEVFADGLGLGRGFHDDQIAAGLFGGGFARRLFGRGLCGGRFFGGGFLGRRFLRCGLFGRRLFGGGRFGCFFGGRLFGRRLFFRRSFGGCGLLWHRQLHRERVPSFSQIKKSVCPALLVRGGIASARMADGGIEQFEFSQRGQNALHRQSGGCDQHIGGLRHRAERRKHLARGGGEGVGILHRGFPDGISVPGRNAERRHHIPCAAQYGGAPGGQQFIGSLACRAVDTARHGKDPAPIALGVTHCVEGAAFCAGLRHAEGLTQSGDEPVAG